MTIEPMPPKPKTFTDQNLDLGYGVGGANNVTTRNAKPGGSVSPNQNATPKMNVAGADKLISLKKGGKVPETGPYLLHKGEQVTPANKVKEMADKKTASKKPEAKKTDSAMDGLGKPSAAAPRAKKSIHMHIEPTDNKGFIVKHVNHENGVPTGKTKSHVFSKAPEMHAHVAKTFPGPAADMAAAAPPPGPAAGAPPAPVATAPPAPVPGV